MPTYGVLELQNYHTYGDFWDRIKLPLHFKGTKQSTADRPEIFHFTLYIVRSTFPIYSYAHTTKE